MSRQFLEAPKTSLQRLQTLALQSGWTRGLPPRCHCVAGETKRSMHTSFYLVKHKYSPVSGSCWCLHTSSCRKRNTAHGVAGAAGHRRIQVDDSDAGLSTVRCRPTGTVKYVAPEIARAAMDGRDADVSRAADVFSYGVLLVQLFCGGVAWTTVEVSAGTWSRLRVRANPDSAPPLLEPLVAARLPQGLVELIKACTSWRPANRPSFRSIVESLRKLELEMTSA